MKRSSIIIKQFVATAHAKVTLQPGDKIGVRKYGRKRVITFSHFDGSKIIGKSSTDHFAAISIYSINGNPVNFNDL